MPKYMKDVIIFNNRVSSKRRKKVFEDLDELESNLVLPSSIGNRIMPKEEKKSKEEKRDDEPDEWLSTIVNIKAPKQNKKLKKKFEGFIRGAEEGEGKKKKKKNGSETTNFYKEFEPELNALKDLFNKQTKFSESLQQMYDEMVGKKATTRGIGKFTIDLVEAVSQSRSTTLSVLDKIIGAKKTISELTMKEKEKFGKKTGSEFEDNAQFASAFLSKAIQGGKELNAANLPFDVGYSDLDNYDDISNLLDSTLLGDERDPSVEAFLKYENKGIDVYIMMDEEQNWNFIAEDPDGNLVDDYPLPRKGKMTFLTDMGKAIDEYGQEYRLKMQ